MQKSNKGKFKAIKSNKDYRTLVSNFGYLTLLQFAGYLFPLITIPYLARVIGADGLGRIAFASAVTAWFLSVTTWGFNYTATRDAARNRHDVQKLSEIFSNVFWARLSLTVVSLFVLVFLILIIPSFRENALVIIVTFLTIPANIFFPEWMFQALERMRYITILSILSKCLFTLLIFLVITKKEDYYLEPLVSAIGSFVSGFIALYFIISRWNIKLQRPSFTRICMTIRGGADIFINNFIPNLWHSMSTVFLGAFYGGVANGILSAGDKCLHICQQFLNIISRTFFPFLSRHLEKHGAYAKLSIFISLVMSILLFLFAPLLIHILYTDEFVDAITVARILAFSPLFMTISEVYGTNYLILKGYERQLRNITAFFSIIGFFMALVLVYSYSYYGAAITLISCRGMIAIAKMSYSLNIKRRDNERKVEI